MSTAESGGIGLVITASERTCAVDAAIECHGMSYVLNRRAVKLNRYIVILRFSGLLGVALVGAVVLLVPGSRGDFALIIWLACVLNILNFFASLASMNWNWDQKYHDYIESIKENNWLSGEFGDLFRDTALASSTWRVKYEECKMIHSRRKEKDAGVHISDKERHRGYRAGLLQFQQTCGQCANVPSNMNPTDCHSCGQF